MRDMVKSVFLLMMASTVALLLWFALFGQSSTGWKGALYYACTSVEQGIAAYYYYYCYVPSVHATDSVDKALGGTINTVENTKSNLAWNENCTFTEGEGANEHYYSTGWQ